MTGDVKPSRRGFEGVKSRKKVLIAGGVAEELGRGIGRIRMRRVPDASADSLQAFVGEAVAPGNLMHTHTTGWLGHQRLEKRGYRHRVTLPAAATLHPCLPARP